jgi:hypothetical protein
VNLDLLGRLVRKVQLDRRESQLLVGQYCALSLNSAPPEAVAWRDVRATNTSLMGCANADTASHLTRVACIVFPPLTGPAPRGRVPSVPRNEMRCA